MKNLNENSILHVLLYHEKPNWSNTISSNSRMHSHQNLGQDFHGIVNIAFAENIETILTECFCIIFSIFLFAESHAGFYEILIRFKIKFGELFSKIFVVGFSW